MATVNAVILKHQKKLDNTWNVKISINHKSQARYIDTPAYVTKSSLDTKGKLKQTYIDKNFVNQLTEYRNLITSLGAKVNYMSSSDIKEMLLLSNSRVEIIDVVSELEKMYSQLLYIGKKTKGDHYKAISNHLITFSKSKTLNAINVTPMFLQEFEKYLLVGVSMNTCITYMGYFKTAFNEIRNRVNNPSIDYIPLPMDPFYYHKIARRPITKRRNLSVDNFKKILLYTPKGKLENMAKDLFILSFCLCGINAKDIFINITAPKEIGELLEYKRSKTKGKRKDEALTSVVVLQEIESIYNKYAGVIQNQYSDYVSFKNALQQGWRKLSESIGFKCTMYYARHSFANIARSVCKFSKDDVSFALNHKYGIDITDVYMDPDWSVVHKVQQAVIDVVFNEEK